MEIGKGGGEKKTGGSGEGFCVSIARTNRITAEEREPSAADRPWSVCVCVFMELAIYKMSMHSIYASKHFFIMEV